MAKRINKERTIRELRENAMVTFRIECNICGKEEESESEDMAVDAAECLGKFENQLWKDGWRYSVSKTYGYIGLHCPECHKNRNKPENY